MEEEEEHLKYRRLYDQASSPNKFRLLGNCNSPPYSGNACDSLNGGPSSCVNCYNGKYHAPSAVNIPCATGQPTLNTCQLCAAGTYTATANAANGACAGSSAGYCSAPTSSTTTATNSNCAGPSATGATTQAQCYAGSYSAGSSGDCTIATGGTCASTTGTSCSTANYVNMEGAITALR